MMNTQKYIRPLCLMLLLALVSPTEAYGPVTGTRDLMHTSSNGLNSIGATAPRYMPMQSTSAMLGDEEEDDPWISPAEGWGNPDSDDNYEEDDPWESTEGWDNPYEDEPILTPIGDVLCLFPFVVLFFFVTILQCKKRKRQKI